MNMSKLPRAHAAQGVDSFVLTILFQATICYNQGMEARLAPEPNYEQRR